MEVAAAQEQVVKHLKLLHQKLVMVVTELPHLFLAHQLLMLVVGVAHIMLPVLPEVEQVEQVGVEMAMEPLPLNHQVLVAQILEVAAEVLMQMVQKQAARALFFLDTQSH